MKAPRVITCLLFVMAFVPLQGFTQDKYVPLPDEELFGTWFKDTTVRSSSNADPMGKSVVFAGGYRNYTLRDDSEPAWEGTEAIAAKWTDPDGSILYRINGEITTGSYAGMMYQELTRISGSGAVKETVWFQVYKYEDRNYPPKIDPQDATYSIMNRATAEDLWSLNGSWVNRSYETSAQLQARIVFADKGVMLTYQRLSDKSALKEKYIVDRSWTESGIHWYQLRQVDPHVTLFILAKLTDGGNTFEAVSAMGAYPDSFESGTRNQTYQRESAR